MYSQHMVNHHPVLQLPIIKHINNLYISRFVQTIYLLLNSSRHLITVKLYGSLHVSHCFLSVIMYYDS